jgi:hypothetical protein
MTATQSLSKFGAYTGGVDQQVLMPKLKFRFRVNFVNLGVSGTATELTRQVVTVARPSVTFDPVELPVYNSKVYLAGRPTWEAISVTLRDDATGSVSKKVATQLQKQFDFMEQASASSGSDYKFKMTIEMLDGGNGNNAPIALETWELVGCFLTQVNYGEVDYGSNDPATITMSIRYDNAVQVVADGGAGITDATTGRGTTGGVTGVAPGVATA